ncbi:uncharacterized protein LOC125722184 [Brienomyrus brachyistius]|nr:uncharacterized protein LOC125722184 [Brienomyrus brachyistius]
MAQRERIERADRWTNTQHWEAWNLWDEVINWGEGVEEFSPVTLPTVQAGGVKGGLGGSTDLGKGGESVGKDGLLASTSISSQSLQSNYGLSSEDWEIYKTCYLNKKKKVRKDRTSRGEGEVRGQSSEEYVEVPEWGTFEGKASRVVMEGTEAGISMMDMLNGGEENVCEVGVNVEEVKGGGGKSTGNAVEYVVSQVGRTWLEPIQEEDLEEDEERDEELQEAEDTDAATVDSWQCMAAYVARIWLQTLQEDGPEENEEADVVFQQAEDADATTLVRFQCMVASEDR